MSDDELQPFRLPVPDAAPGLRAAPGGMGDGSDAGPDDEGSAPEPGRSLTRALAWAGLGLAAAAVLGGLWLPAVAGILPAGFLLIQAANRRRWDDFRTRTLGITGTVLCAVAIAATLGGAMARSQRDSVHPTSWADAREGQCLVSFDPDLLTVAAVRRCGLEHRAYVAYTQTWPQGERPTNDQLRDDTSAACSRHLKADYPGLWAQGGDGKKMWVDIVYPLDAQWKAGDRTTVCVVRRWGDEPLAGPTADEIDSATHEDSALAR